MLKSEYVIVLRMLYLNRNSLSGVQGLLWVTVYLNFFILLMRIRKHQNSNLNRLVWKNPS